MPSLARPAKRRLCLNDEAGKMEHPALNMVNEASNVTTVHPWPLQRRRSVPTSPPLWAFSGIDKAIRGADDDKPFALKEC